MRSINQYPQLLTSSQNHHGVQSYQAVLEIVVHVRLYLVQSGVESLHRTIESKAELELVSHRRLEKTIITNTMEMNNLQAYMKALNAISEDIDKETSLTSNATTSMWKEMDAQFRIRSDSQANS